MGVTTYRIMAEFAAQGEPGTESLNAAQKYVVSSTLTDPLGWPNTTIIDGDLHQSVARLKESGATLRTMRSLSLCRSLLVAGLVDRFELVVFPVITGATGRDNIYRGYPDVMAGVAAAADPRRPTAAARVPTDGAGRPAGNLSRPRTKHSWAAGIRTPRPACPRC